MASRAWTKLGLQGMLQSLLVICFREKDDLVIDLQGHAVNDELHGEVFAVSWDAVAEGWLGSIILAVFVDQVPEDLIQHGGPDGTDVVHTVVSVDGGVDERVGGQAGGVWVLTDTAGVVGSPGTHGVVSGAGVARLETDGSGEEVTPSFTHTTGLESSQAAGVGGSTAETVGN